MRRQQLKLSSICIGVLLIAACDSENASSLGQNNTTLDAPQQQHIDAQNQTMAVENAPSVSTAEQRLLDELETLQSRIEDLENKAEQQTKDTKSSIVEELNALQEQRESLQGQVTEMAASSVQAVNGFLDRINESLEGLTRSVDMETEGDDARIDSSALDGVKN